MPAANYWTRSDISFTLSDPHQVIYENPVLDVDGDGDLDFIALSSLYPIEDRGVGLRIMLNNGAGVFTDATATFFPGGAPVTIHPRDWVIRDFNGDGRPDIFIADHGLDGSPFPGAQNTLLYSNGAHGFVDATNRLPTLRDFTHSTTAGDIDGDGDVDILVVNTFGGTPNSGSVTAPYFLVNDGLGNFARSDTRLPSDVASRTFGRKATDSLLFDADHDGDLDLFLGTHGETTNAYSRVYLNSGNGNFSSATEIATPNPPIAPASTVALDSDALDLNGDGWLDLVVTFTGAYNNKYYQVLINDGAGHFTDETALRLPQTLVNNGQWTIDLQFVDMNGDGFVDLFAENATVQPIALNDGSGHFVWLPDSFLDYGGFGSPAGTHRTAFDATGDGRADILVSYSPGQYWLYTQQDLGATQTGDDNANGLMGDASNETLSGLGGDDVIFGAQGDDAVDGGAGADYLNGGAGDDHLNGGVGADVILGGDGNDVLWDTFFNSGPHDSNSDALSGGNGDDILWGGWVDRYDGGEGIDEARVNWTGAPAGPITLDLSVLDSGGDVYLPGGGVVLNNVERIAVTFGLGPGYFTGSLRGDEVFVTYQGSSPSILNGGGGDDYLQTISIGADEIYGGAGSDRIRAWDDSASDLLDGGEGDDSLWGGASDRFVGGAGVDVATYVASPSESAIDLRAVSASGTGVVLATNTMFSNVESIEVILAFGGQALVFGHDGVNRIFAEDQNDVLFGMGGDDALFAGGGNDFLDGGAGSDWLYGEDGDDTLYADSADALIDGGAGIDWVYFLGAGNVTLDAGAYGFEVVVLTAVSGADIIYAASQTDVFTVYAAGGNDVLTGGSNNDNLYGQEGNDTIVGGAGNDLIWGEGGADSLSGGANDDTLIADALDTLVSGGAGLDWVYYVGVGNVTLNAGANGVEVVVLTSATGNDTMNAATQTAVFTVYAAGGNDTLTGGSNNDNLYGQDGNDTIVGGDGNDTIWGEAGSDSLSGGNGDDTLIADSTDTLVSGGAGINDWVYFIDAGAVTLDAGAAGIEVVFTNGGNDVLNAATQVNNFAAYAGGGADTITGGSGNDGLFGQDGDDTIVGGNGDDVLLGENGNDRLTGGGGGDILAGGTGADTFVFAAGWGGDSVLDFANGVDHFDFTALAGNGVHAFSDLGVGTSGADAIVSWSGNLFIVANGAGAIDASDFLFA